MSKVDIKQIAIKKLQESRGFIVICDDDEQTYFGGDGVDLNKAIGLIERYKYQLLLDNYKAKGGRVLDDDNRLLLE